MSGMKEACYCGRTGEVEDPEPVYLGDGEHALRCPDCGHLEDLHCLSRDARETILEEPALRRHCPLRRKPA
ncbi:MAG TPA: hypothetical protein VFV45_05125, partial [Rubrobacteraceae bacterium]|nr:hypothetical protein [Rubrobacteraceae bacterium]